MCGGLAYLMLGYGANTATNKLCFFTLFVYYYLVTWEQFGIVLHEPVFLELMPDHILSG